jgi:hypothetical protein
MAPRLTTAGLALVGGAIFGAVSTVAALDATSIAGGVGRNGWMIPGVISLGALALLGLALALADARPVFLALALFGAAWLVGIPNSTPWHTLTAIAGGGLLAVAELTYWSVDFKVAGKDQLTIHLRRAATIAALVAASIALALVPQLDLSAIPVGGIELTSAGLLAAAVLIAVAAAMAWRLRSSD